jgi:hypothetical protein
MTHRPALRFALLVLAGLALIGAVTLLLGAARSTPQRYLVGFEPNLTRPNSLNLMAIDQAGMAFRAGAVGSSLTLIGAGLFTSLAALGVSLFPLRFGHMQEALLHRPRRSLLAGLLACGFALGLGGLATLLARLAPPLGLLTGLGGVLALVTLSLVGWMALALRLGEAITYCLTCRYLPPAVEISLGGAVLVLLWHLLLFVPFGLGAALPGGVLVGSLGLGAALLTHLGGRSIRPIWFVQG